MARLKSKGLIGPISDRIGSMLLKSRYLPGRRPRHCRSPEAAKGSHRNCGVRIARTIVQVTILDESRYLRCFQVSRWRLDKE